MLSGESVSDDRKSSGPQKQKNAKPNASQKDQKFDEQNVEVLLRDIDSTQHPEITSTNTTLNNSLMVLQIALRDHSTDGLTPTDISRILTEKFRVGTTKYTVSMALGKATTLVNRIPKGQGYIYKIMKAGEEHLLSPSSTKTSKPISKSKKVVGKKVKSIKKVTKAAVKKSNKSGKTGPKAAINRLISEGFFNTSKTGPEVQTHLNKKHGLNFGIDQLRLAMLRLVREQILERDENDKGQYEYKKK